MIWLATCTLADGDLTNGIIHGHHAVQAVTELHSTRLVDHLEPLHTQALHTPGPDARQLAHDIAQLRAAA